jgi:cytochrome c peroxidase
LRRNAPSLLNVAFEELLMRDGEAPSLQSQVLGPLFELHEMANPTFKGLIARIERLPDYQDRFEKAFGAPISVPLIGRAIASYERSLLCARSPFDRWRFRGESGAMGARAQEGFRLFAGKAGCLACHPVGAQAALFTDHGFHNTGVGFRPLPAAGTLEDRGRQEVTHEAGDLHKFKTPSLRNVAHTSPYMHDGSLKSLADVVRYYNGGGSGDPAQDAPIRPLGLSEEEIGDLIAFLESLNCDGIEPLIDDARSATGGH